MSPPDKGLRLGRGLAALMGEASSAAPSGTGTQDIAVDHLEPNPYQPRGTIEPESLAELVASINARGILQPLLVRPSPNPNRHYQIIAGERRWRAARQAGLRDVPCLVRVLTDSEAAAAALVENLQRQDLNAIEEAEGFARLRDEFGLTQENLATAIGKSRPHIANALRLLNLPDAVQLAVKAGDLTAGHARALLAHADPILAMRTVLERGLNVRQTEALIGRPKSTESPATTKLTPTKDVETAAVERDLMERLGLRVEIQHGPRGGSVRIHYQTLDQLDAVVERLGR